MANASTNCLHNIYSEASACLSPVSKAVFSGWIYCIADDSGRVVKVGVSKDPAARLKSLPRLGRDAQACRAHLGLPPATRRHGRLSIAQVWRTQAASAFVLEQAVHWALGKLPCFISGEWYAATPAEAEPIIAAVVKETHKIWRRQGVV